MPSLERVEDWRTGLAMPHAHFEPTGRPFITLTVKSEAGALVYPFSIEAARTLAEELEALCREAESLPN